MTDFIFYHLPPKADGSAHDADLVAIMSDLEARAGAAFALDVALLDPATRASAAMVGYAIELLRRARAWAWVHYSRGDERELPASAQAFADLAETLETLQEAAEARRLSDSIVWGAGKAYDAALRIAERDAGGFYQEASRDQEGEAKESPIRSLVWSLALINDRHWLMSEGSMTAEEAQLSASEIFFHAPMPPTAEEDIVL